jgi:hypothetical protein
MTAFSNRQPSFLLLLLGAWAVAVVQLMISGWAVTAETLMDTDDAMRLVQVRELIQGRGWFELHMNRVEPPLGYHSHWSRLIDAGLAGLYLLFRPIAEPLMAERLMRAIWPMIWLLVAIAGAASIAWRIGGRQAALIALLFGAIGLPAFQQYNPGRIDHHNVQISLSLVLVAAAVWANERRIAAIGCGLVSGLMLAVGFEAIAFVVLVGALVGLRYVIVGDHPEAVADYGWSLALSTAIGLMVSLPVSRLGEAACDAIAVNTAWPVTMGGFLLFLLVRRRQEWGPGMRLLRVGAAGAAALGMFLMIEPLCLKGPFAFVDPAVKPIWLDKVAEVQPLSTVIKETPVTGAGVMAFPLVALIGAVLLGMRREIRGDFGFLAPLSAFLLGIAMTLPMIRSFSYAVWFGLPLLAAAAAHLFSLVRLETLLAKTLIAFLLTPSLISAAAISATEAAGYASAAAKDTPEKKACFAMKSYEKLARLPKGLVAAPVDLGPHILALTPHDVLSAPYHRLSAGIIASTRIFAEKPEAARQILTATQATYLVTCGGRKADGIVEESMKPSLFGQLLLGKVPDWLEPMTSGSTDALVVYRLRTR